jgi:type IV secretory pathway VirB6-like protein
VHSLGGERQQQKPGVNNMIGPGFPICVIIIVLFIAFLGSAISSFKTYSTSKQKIDLYYGILSLILLIGVISGSIAFFIYLTQM